MEVGPKALVPQGWHAPKTNHSLPQAVTPNFFCREKEPYTHVLKIKESYTLLKNSYNTYKFIRRLGLAVRIREMG
jgi:hypothetical protein